MTDLMLKYKDLKQIFIFKLAGSKNIKTVKEIEKMIGLNNRTTRDLISKLKTELPIVSLSGSKEVNSLRGYFFFDGNPDDIKYLEHCQNEYRSRIKDYVNTIKVLEEAKNKTLQAGKNIEQLFLFHKENKHTEAA